MSGFISDPPLIYDVSLALAENVNSGSPSPSYAVATSFNLEYSHI